MKRYENQSQTKLTNKIITKTIIQSSQKGSFFEILQKVVK